MTTRVSPTDAARVGLAGVCCIGNTVRVPYNTTSGRDCVKSLRLCLHGTCPQRDAGAIGSVDVGAIDLAGACGTWTDHLTHYLSGPSSFSSKRRYAHGRCGLSPRRQGTSPYVGPSRNLFARVGLSPNLFVCVGLSQNPET